MAYSFYSSGLYDGPVTETEPQVSISGLLIPVLVLVVLKLAIYDLIGLNLQKKSATTFSKSIFYGGYGIALAIDLFSIFMALKPIYMNLALFGTILYSLPVLILAILMLVVRSLFLRYKSS